MIVANRVTEAYGRCGSEQTTHPHPLCVNDPNKNAMVNEKWSTALSRSASSTHLGSSLEAVRASIERGAPVMTRPNHPGLGHSTWLYSLVLENSSIKLDRDPRQTEGCQVLGVQLEEDRSRFPHETTFQEFRIAPESVGISARAALPVGLTNVPGLTLRTLRIRRIPSECNYVMAECYLQLAGGQSMHR